jgi:hypothetical protein
MPELRESIAWRKPESAIMERSLKPNPQNSDLQPDTSGETRVAPEVDSQPSNGGDTVNSAAPAAAPIMDEYMTRLPVGGEPSFTPSALMAQHQGKLLSEEGYKLVKRLGSGSFGEVWLAKAPGGVDAAIKVISRPMDDQTSQKELQALELIKSLRHPYLLSTQSFWQQQDRLYIAMELADGTLSDRIKECVKAGMHGIPVEELLGYFREAGEAIDYLNSQNVQHRDIKPDNILLLKKHAKVADFGLARLQEDLMIAASTCGTPSYMPPEIWKGQISHHSDQYSLAATYVHLRRNRKPFEGTALHQLMLSHMEQPADLSPLPDAEQDVLLKALAKDPSKRHGSCTEFVRALEQALSPKPETGSQTIAVSDRTWAEYLTRAMLVIVPVLALVAFLLFRSASPAVPASFAIDPLPALRLSAGERDHLTVHIARQGAREPVRLSFSGMPPGIDPVEERVVAADEDSADVELVAGPKVAAGRALARVLAEVGENRQEATLEIVTIPMPPGTSKVGTEPSEPDLDGKQFWPRIVRDLGGGDSVAFVLVPKLLRKDPESFYMMENKVSRRLFKRFVEANPGITWKAMNQPETDDDFPAQVPWVAACRFSSEHLSGHLPAAVQWDRAAGLRRGPSDRMGPYQGTWDGDKKLDIALTAYRKVGSARDDVSPSRCRDMAGNGLEWTRDIFGSSRTGCDVKLTENDAVIVRGKAIYSPDPRPLTYKDMEDNPSLLPALENPKNDPKNDMKDYASFRVVLELER